MCGLRSGRIRSAGPATIFVAADASRLGGGLESGRDPQATSGLRVQAIATGLEHPRSVYTLPNGDVLVVERAAPTSSPSDAPKTSYELARIEGHLRGANTGNRITLLRDPMAKASRTSEPCFSTIFILRSGWRWSATISMSPTPMRSCVSLQHRRNQHHGPGTVLTPLPGGPIDHHWTKSLVASEDGTKLYVGVGSNSNITENGMGAEYERAAIWEVDRATGAHRIFASGLRNPNGLSWEPQSHALWTVVNERDELGPNLVPDYLTSVKDGGFYGWPYSYYGRISTRGSTRSGRIWWQMPLCLTMH